MSQLIGAALFDKRPCLTLNKLPTFVNHDQQVHSAKAMGSDLATAQCIVYWLGGMTQKSIARRFGWKTAAAVSSRIWHFIAGHHPDSQRDDRAPGWLSDIENFRDAPAALDSWLRKQRIKPRLRLAGYG